MDTSQQTFESNSDRNVSFNLAIITYKGEERDHELQSRLPFATANMITL